MGTLSSAVVCSNLELLFRQLGIRRWEAPLALDDIGALIGRRLRVSGEVAHAALEAGFFIKNGDVFQLTREGKAEARRIAAQDPGGSAVILNSQNPQATMSHADSGNSESIDADQTADSENSEFAQRSTSEGEFAEFGSAYSASRSDCRSSLPKGDVDLRVQEIRSDQDLISGSDLDPDLTRAIPVPPAPPPAQGSRSKRSASFATPAVVASAKQLIGSVNLVASADRARALAMLQTFEQHKQLYQRKVKFGFALQRIQPGDRLWNHCLKAAQLAESLGVDYETYIRAQFHFFDAWFSRAPRFWEIATATRGRYNAVERVRAYQREVVSGTVDPKRQILGRVRAAPVIPAAVRIQQGDRTLRSLMATHKATEEQIIRAFAAGPQAALYFDQTWLKQNGTYQRLRAAGEI